MARLHLISIIRLLAAVDAFVATTVKSLSILKASFEDSFEDPCDVAIIGGGFGGIYSALAISRGAKRLQRTIDIVLCDSSERFIFLPLLYDLTMGTASEAEVCPNFNEVLEGTNIRFVKASFDGFIDDRSTSARLVTDYGSTMTLSSKSFVIAVGSTPQSILASVPGAIEYTQPFYTRDDAYSVRELLFRMDQKIRQGEHPRIAIIGGGYGGCELAACISRRLPNTKVKLISRYPPMNGTRAKDSIDQVLKKLGVVSEISIVVEMKKKNTSNQITICRTNNDGTFSDLDTDEIFDAVLWTAGSSSSQPVANKNGKMGELTLSSSNRLIVDKTLRCVLKSSNGTVVPSVWALGDCCEIPSMNPVPPKTAQAAIQQADVVASNVLNYILDLEVEQREFEFKDLGSMLTLGGPNGMILGPNDDSQLGTLLVPLLDTARFGLDFADVFLSKAISSVGVNKDDNVVGSVVKNRSLSFGGYGLGINPDSSEPGTLSGTLSGISRRAIYALRMPTDKQRAVAGVSAFLSLASSLLKETSDQLQNDVKENEKHTI